MFQGECFGCGDNHKAKMIPAKSLVTDRRAIKLEEILKETYIPFLGGRPKRDEIISKDDMTNLSIAFGLSKDVSKFLELV